MSADFHEFYALLNLAPGASWRDLKTAYRSQMRKWHPDRFPENPSDRQRAEERTKSINYAYDQLARYHQEYGFLPLTPTQSAAAPSSNADWSPAPHVPKESSAARPALGRTQRALMIAGIGVAAYVLIRAAGIFGDAASPSAMDESTPQPHRVAPTESPVKPIFGFGSTLGEVYTAQGIPTHTEGDIWYYGASKVYFAHGSVVRWEESPSHPLNTRPHLVPVPRPAHFSVGSTKADVRAIQGEPVRESQNVWDYGISRIYFESDRVVSWQESPMDPLKVKR